MSNLTRYDPMEDLFRGFFVRPMEFPALVTQQQSIRMDIEEKEDLYLIHAELPGVKKENIHVMIDGNLLSISAEIKEEKSVKEGERVLRAERYFGKVSRSVQLAQDINDTEASAKFVDGVLELSLPKKAVSASKRLSIQ